MSRDAWECRQCGRCCHAEIPVTVWDIERLRKELNETPESVFARMVDPQPSKHSSVFKIRKQPSGGCVFLDEQNTCSIHSEKPRICDFFTCQEQSAEGGTPLAWTARCHDPQDQLRIWEESVAVEATRCYIKKYGCLYDENGYRAAIESVRDQIVTSDGEQAKLARNEDGSALAMVYDCESCPNRGEHVKETPVTLLDIQGMAAHLNMSIAEFFTDCLTPASSTETGGLQLKRNRTCLFFDPISHCSITTARPMHCRFTPCPQRVKLAGQFDRFFLAAGTVSQQFRHQVALHWTRRYVEENGVHFRESAFYDYLACIERDEHNVENWRNFCDTIRPYRFIDDTSRSCHDSAEKV